MPITDIYSKRQKRLRGETPDVFKYEEMPHHLRVQIVYIIRAAIGEPTGSYGGIVNDPYKLYQYFRDALRTEYGVFQLLRDNYTPYDEVLQFFLNCDKVDECIDVIELCFHAIDIVVRDKSYQFNMKDSINVTPDEAIDELNARFFEHGIGYQFDAGEIIRVDSKLLHSEVVKPVLQVLSNPLYVGANSEFLSAHEHYRHGRYTECLNECLKAFESTMKIICTKRGWTFESGDTARKLIDICFQKNLIPPYLQDHFAGLRKVLESGVPTIRNKLSGHGQGVNTVNIPEHFASYMLHMTATTILFLVELEEA